MAPECVPAPTHFPSPSPGSNFQARCAAHTSASSGLRGRRGGRASGRTSASSTLACGQEAGTQGGGETPGDQTGPGRASRRGSQRLRSPSRACPAPSTNRSHIQGESSRVRPLPRPRLSAPEPMARRGGRAGLGVVSPPRVIIPHSVERLHLCAGTCRPLSGRAVRGILPRTLFLGLRALPLLPSRAGRAEVAPPQVAAQGPPPADLSPDTQEARGPIPAPLCSPAGLRARAPPPPASRCGGSGHRSWPAPGAPQVPSIWPAPNQGPFCLVILPCGLRAELGGGGAPNTEPAQVSVGAGPGGASSGRGRDGGGGRPGRTVLESELRPAGWPAFGGDGAVPPPGSPAPSVGGAHAALGSCAPSGACCAQRGGPGRGGRVA